MLIAENCKNNLLTNYSNQVAEDNKGIGEQIPHTSP
jgi:hypothetical protein